jgi:hypothetical protein
VYAHEQSWEGPNGCLCDLLLVSSDMMFQTTNITTQYVTVRGQNKKPNHKNVSASLQGKNPTGMQKGVKILECLHCDLTCADNSNLKHRIKRQTKGTKRQSEIRCCSFRFIWEVSVS